MIKAMALRQKPNNPLVKYFNATLASAVLFFSAKLIIIDLLALYTYTNVM